MLRVVIGLCGRMTLWRLRGCLMTELRGERLSGRSMASSADSCRLPRSLQGKRRKLRDGGGAYGSILSPVCSHALPFA